MNIALTDAQKRFAEIVRRAENGEEVVLTRQGRPVARIAPVEKRRPTSEQKRAAIAEIRAAARKVPFDGVSAARSQDYLYDEDGLPK